MDIFTQTILAIFILANFVEKSTFIWLVGTTFPKSTRAPAPPASEIFAAVMDGADWQQGFVDYHRSDAVRILDFSHAAQRITGVGQVLFGEGIPATHQWIEPRLRQQASDSRKELRKKHRSAGDLLLVAWSVKIGSALWGGFGGVHIHFCRERTLCTWYEDFLRSFDYSSALRIRGGKPYLDKVFWVQGRNPTIRIPDERSERMCLVLQSARFSFAGTGQ